MARQRKVIRTKRLYKKSSGKRKILGWIFFVLALFILVAFGFIVSKEWSKRFGPNAIKPSSNTSSRVSKPSGNTSSDASSENSSNSEIPEQASIKSSYVSAEMLSTIAPDGYKAYFDKIKADGFNSVVIQLKTDDGKLYYNSQIPYAKSMGMVSETAADINLLTKAIKEAGLKPIAKISALKDATAHVKNDNSYAYGDSLDTNWLDNRVNLGGKSWLNPYMPKAREYVAALAGEISMAGFEVIVLDNVMFPDKFTSQMNPINENKPRSEILKQVLDEAQVAAKDAVVVQGISLENIANINAKGYNNDMAGIAYKGISPVIDTAVINATLEEIKKSGITADTDIMAINALLEKAVGLNENAMIMPIIKANDEAKILPILKQLKIDSYVVMN